MNSSRHSRKLVLQCVIVWYGSIGDGFSNGKQFKGRCDEYMFRHELSKQAKNAFQGLILVI